MLILTVIQGPDKGRKFELPDHEPQLIGRSSESLPLSDNTVSRRHAELTPDDGMWYVRDLHSQNGTDVNGVRISERMRLKNGDQVRTASTLFAFGQTEEDPNKRRRHRNRARQPHRRRGQEASSRSLIRRRPAHPARLQR